MKMVVPITIDDDNMTTDADAEDYDVWGSDYSEKRYGYAPASLRIVAVNALNGEIWVKAGAYIYKKESIESQWETCFYGYYVYDIDVNPYTGRVYCTQQDTGTGDYLLREVDTGDYSLTTIGTIPSGTIGSAKLSIDVFTSDIFVAGAGNDNVYKYDESSGSFSVHAATGLSSIRDLAVDPSSKDIYVIEYSARDVYVQNGSTGAFSLLINTASLENIQVNLIDYSLILGYQDEIATAAYGSSTKTSLFTPTETAFHCYFDFASLTYFLSSELVEMTCYTARIFYQDDYCIYNDHVYVALSDTYDDRPGTDDTVWFDYGATNPYRMFDGTISTPTIATGSINLTLENDNVTAIGFFGMTAQEIQVVLTVDMVEVYNETIELRSTEVGDWYEYFFNPINQVKDTVFENIPAYSSGDFEITISGASVSDAVEAGLMIPGYSYDVGNTKRGVKPGFVNYSTTEVDPFGRISITSRGSAKTLDCECFLDSRAQASTVIDLYNRTKDLKCLWIGSRDADTWSLIYGVCKRFDATIEDNNGRYSLQILGVV